jgi:hypothetical protein
MSARSRQIVWAACVLAAAVAIGFVAFRSWRPQVEEEAPVPSPPARAAAEVEVAEPGPLEAPVLTRAFEESRHEVQFLDFVSSSPLIQCEVRAVDASGQDLATGRTDLAGRVILEGMDRRAAVRWILRVPVQAGKLELEHPVGLVPDAALETVLVPFLARVRVALPDLPQDEREARSWVISAWSLPEVPQVEDPKQMRHLRFLRRASPQEIHLQLKELSLGSQCHVAEARADPRARAAVVDIPFTGEVRIDCSAPYRIGESIRHVARQGEVTACTLRVREMSVVAGRVLEGDVPKPGVRVTVSVHSFFRDDEPAPFGPKLGHARLIIRPLDGSGTDHVFVLSADTDGEGRFRVAMPFTDRVLAYVPSDSLGAWYRAYIDVPDRYEPVTDLELRAFTRGPGARMQLAEWNGMVVASRKIRIVAGDDCLQFSHPTRSTDEEGWFSIEDLADDVDYRIRVDGEHGRAAAWFRGKPGGRVTLDA